ncbi:unnamed protein product [Clonostachys rosea f. rosea IK726]|uniref:Aminoglycoside phosphotransferase domain-containing protein n=2 Tax=Bionectria ochroleuca TaxID=29856 RepID=A0A0B7K827_BIOOC|nr:unnamed protein product [Clonostachys rosea f. rosea IK726]
MIEGDQAYLESCKDEHMPVPPFDRYIYVLPKYVVKKPLSIGETGYQGYKPDVETVSQRDENEIEAMKLVQEYTNIPIPRVLHRGEGFNVFERIQGVTVNEKSIWDRVNPRQREAIRLQVQGFIQQLAAIPNLTGEVRSLVPSGQIFHLQLPNRGPFKSTKDFTKAYADHSVLGAISSESKPVFSHMDLDLSNLILHPNLDSVAGVIDWERACFFPEGGRSIHHMCHQWSGWETLFDGLKL